MANPEHLAILKQGVEEWNRSTKKWREDHVTPDLSDADLKGVLMGSADFESVDLHGADLAGRDLTETNLRGADLRWADLETSCLRGADLGDADLSEAYLYRANLDQANLERASLFVANLLKANLVKANLSGAFLRMANLRKANLCEANLGGADLTEADLREAKVHNADFTDARAYETVFADVNLSVAKGLETVVHPGPSTIGIDTVYKSHGNIPDVFLRGCGVADEMIGFIKSVAGSIQFYSCFISYSTKDQEFADRLYADLQNKGVRCWFAPHDIQGGRKIHEQIDDAIRVHDKLLLILSEGSMNSDWVGTEIANAREGETQEKKQMLFPISLAPFEKVKGWKLFDAERGKDSAREIREYFIPDFSNWKDHDSYQKAFQRLVKDLKAAPQD